MKELRVVLWKCDECRLHHVSLLEKGSTLAIEPRSGRALTMAKDLLARYLEAAKRLGEHFPSIPPFPEDQKRFDSANPGQEKRWHLKIVGEAYLVRVRTYKVRA